jgi:hypothetical protein
MSQIIKALDFPRQKLFGIAIQGPARSLINAGTLPLPLSGTTNFEPRILNFEL